MNPSLIFKIPPGGCVRTYRYFSWTNVDGAHGCLNVCVNWAHGGGRGGDTAVRVLPGAIKRWLSCQLKGSEVKLILSETGWRWASWRGGVGVGGCDPSIVMMDREEAEGVFSAQKISGDKRWARVAGQFCDHLMLFSETSKRKQKVGVGGGGWGGVALGTLSNWLRRHSALSENTSVEVKKNFFLNSEAPGGVGDITQRGQTAWKASDRF